MVASSCEPQIRYDLAAGTGSDPYTGLDRFGRVVDLLWRNCGTAEDAVRIKHGYDRAGNRLYREDPVALTHGVDMDEGYTYDGLYQLKTFTRGALSAAKTAIAAPTFRQAWDFDATGNWSRFREDKDADAKWDLDQTRQHNAANEITAIEASVGDLWISPTHDRAGNMLRIPQPKVPTKQFALKWDAWNRLVRVSDVESTVAEYAYDGRNYRIVNRVYRDPSDPLSVLAFPLSHHAYYSSDWRLLEERLGTVAAADRQHVWGLRYIDDLILRDRNADGDSPTGAYGLTASGLEERLYALQDPNWNVVAISGTDGTIAERYSYAAYGKCGVLHAEFTDRSGTAWDWSSLYTGREFDGEAGLYYYRARNYGPELGTFHSSDPIQYKSKDVNLYRYVRNSPIHRVDPMGLTSYPCSPLEWKKCQDRCAQDNTPDVEYRAVGCTIERYVYSGVYIQFRKCVCHGREKCDCTSDRRYQLQQEVVARCRPLTKCDSPMDSQSAMAMAGKWRDCADARDRINKECYRGGNPTHRAEASNARRQAWNCLEVAFKNRPGGTGTGSGGPVTT
jgi:RHS repeat-associated protein